MTAHRRRVSNIGDISEVHYTLGSIERGMTYLVPFLAGLMVGMIVASFVLHWLVGLAEVIGSRSGKPDGQVFREALIFTVANSGFWILVVAAYVAYHVLSGPLDRVWIVGSAGLLSAIALLGVIAYGFGRGGSATLVRRFAESMRRKDKFMLFGFAVGFVIAAPLLYEWFEQGVSVGFLLFIAVVWAAGIYFLLWYMWQFMPGDKPGLVRSKKNDEGNAA